MQDGPPSTFLVVPCYNEEERLDLSAFAASTGCDFLFVNDGSTDGTLRLLGELPPNCWLLDLPMNVGKAEAIRQGMLHLEEMEQAKEAEWVGFWDADLATPLDEVPHFLRFAAAWAPDAQAIFGSRVRRLGSAIERSFVRHYLGRAFATLVGLVLDLHAYDSQCGAKLFRTPHIPRLFSTRFTSRWLFDLEILFRLSPLPVIEYPLTRWRDAPGSKVRIVREAPRVLYHLWLIRRRYRSGG